MNYYCKNLLAAICGKNPYRLELDKLKKEMGATGENVKLLQESYYKEVEKAAEAEKRQDEVAKLLDMYKDIVEKSKKQLMSFQTIVENQRERIKEKDALVEEIRKNYQRQKESYEKRVKGYLQTIGRMKEQMKKLQPKTE